jgi:hypothetical protein
MLTRMFALVFAATCVLTVSAHAADEPAVKSGPEVGKEMPGPFHPYNVTGKRAGDFHDLVSTHGLDPVVLVFVRGTDSGEALKKLLIGLDEAAQKSTKTRLAVAAIFLGEDLKDVVTNDDQRKKLAEKVALIKTDAKLNEVVLCLDSADGPKAYALNPDAEVTVLVGNQLKVVGNYAFPKGGLKNEHADAIVAAVKEKLFPAKK